MKKTGLLLLLLALCLAAASVALAQAELVSRSGELAVYSDGEGRLYLPGREEPINERAAEDIVAIDAYRVLFTSAPDEADETAADANADTADADAAPKGQDLYMIDLESFEETRIAEGIYTACLCGEDTAWYVPQDARDQLMRVSLKDFTAQAAYTAGEPIERLYVSLEGLVLQLTDQAGAMLYVPETDRFEIYNGVVPRSSLMGDSYEIYLTEGNELYLKNDFNYTSELIDSDVTAYARMDGMVYYLTRTGSAMRLMSCDPLTMSRRIVLIPAIDMDDELTASAHALFMLSAEGDVCKADPVTGTITLFRHYDNYDEFDIPEDHTVGGLRVEAMSGQLNVYAKLEEAATKPDFSFIEFDALPEAAEPVLRLIETHPLNGEQTAWDLLKPVPQYAPLARGSRGDAVRAIQQPLYDLGYYNYYVDGIFGPRTQYGVKMLQSDLDRPVTGIADAELQQIILSGKLSPYDPYLPMSRGKRGMRVQSMQERLRELGYLADAADGIFGPRTQKAVQLFQTENGVAFSDAATRETLRKLYADTANRCSSYIDLYPGDTGYRVRELNNRLKALYYLEDSPGSAYTAQTTSAVRVFQRTAGLRETGEATQAVQRALFAENAPEAPGYIVLRRGDDNERVARLQRRLKALNYYSGPVDGYFGRETKEAVALFQK
ncbi:MAG: peptidoglycan-binding protein, partial [Clostridia bacterium]|nr:peptidoglycan-binding protein [Clostridia bacterium]